MIARVLFVFALAYTAAGAKFSNPMEGAEKSIPGGTYMQDSVAQGAFELNTCPDIQFFGNVTISYMSHVGQCLVKYSAVTWTGMTPSIAYDATVTGQATFSKANMALGDIPYYTPCYIVINNVEYEVYTDDHRDDVPVDTFTYGFMNFIDHSKGCSQRAVAYSSSIPVLDKTFFYGIAEETGLPASAVGQFTWRAGATPIGPLSVTQKSDGDFVVSSAFLLSDRIDELSVEEKPDIYDGKNRAEYIKYNLGILLVQGSYVAQEVPPSGPEGYDAMFSISYTESFKKRNSFIQLSGGFIGGLEDGVFNFYFSAFNDYFGKKSLYLSTEFTSKAYNAINDGIDGLYIAEYRYHLVRKNADKSLFSKRQIQEWFGGAKQYYTPSYNENPAGRRPKERNRRKHRRNKRRTGKKQDVRDNRRFKMETP